MTTLPRARLKYVIEYLQTEYEEPEHYSQQRNGDNLNQPATILEMVRDALDAYAGGAR